MELEGFDVLIQYLNGSKKINYGKPPSFSEKFDKSKSKNRKSENVRKRDLLLTLMREKRPDKILKLIQVCIVSFIPFFVFCHFWQQGYEITKILHNLCLYFARQDGQDGKKTERKSRN